MTAYCSCSTPFLSPTLKPEPDFQGNARAEHDCEEEDHNERGCRADNQLVYKLARPNLTAMGTLRRQRVNPSSASRAQCPRQNDHLVSITRSSFIYTPDRANIRPEHMVAPSPHLHDGCPSPAACSLLRHCHEAMILESPDHALNEAVEEKNSRRKAA